MEYYCCGLKIWGFDALQNEDGLGLEQENEKSFALLTLG